MESISGDEGEDSSQVSQDEDDAPPIGEVQSLLQRKQQLERSHRRQEKRQQRVQVGLGERITVKGYRN